MKRKRINVGAITEYAHHKRVIEILSKIYNLSYDKVADIYRKMNYVLENTKSYICMKYKLEMN